MANDAIALILDRFAGGRERQIVLVRQSPGLFPAIVAGEIVWRIGVGWLMLRLRRWIDDPRTEIVLSILTPFLAYWPSAHLGGSGVLVTVTAGLYISWNGLRKQPCRSDERRPTGKLSPAGDALPAPEEEAESKPFLRIAR